MKRLLCVIGLVACLLNLQAQDSQMTTFILIRHAEKTNDGTSDPELTKEGKDRANRLVEVLKDQKIDAIYSTNYKRTRNTVAPVATAKGLEVKVYEPSKPEVLKQILQAEKGKTILMVGHSNTVPWTANQLTGENTYSNFDDADYNNMLIVSVTESSAKVTWLNY
jgi:2,3-bisphosphoglycerate-dependent phosphoglycerate mutase